MPANELQALLPHSKKLPIPLKLSLETIAIVYGHITGLLAWRCISLVTRLPTKTATDLFLIFLSSLVSSSGIINLCRHHLYETAARIQNADESILTALWHELAGDTDTETLARVLALSLKIIGGIAEGCISYATVQQILAEAPEDFKLSFSIVCGLMSCIAFPLVEGSSITEILRSKIDCRINGEIKKDLHFLQPSLLKRIFLPDQAIIAAANNQVTKGSYYAISRTALICTNLLTNLGVLGIAVLAFTDSAELLYQYIHPHLALAIAIPVAGLYFTADTALHAIPTKLTFYGLSVENPKQLITHNPIMFLFTLLQSTTISLIPFIAVNSCYWLLKSDTLDYEFDATPLAVLLASSLLGLARLPLSFCGEGLNLIALIHEKDSNPLFNALFNTLQFSATAGAVAFQMTREPFDVAAMLETYAIAGGVNASLSLTRHGLLSACIDPTHDRTWHHRPSPFLRLLSDFVIPAALGIATEALCLYIILPKETNKTDMKDNIASLAGGLMAGVSAILWRLLANRFELFYKTTEKIMTIPKPNSGDGITHTIKTTCNKVSKFFSSCFYGSSTEEANENIIATPTPNAGRK